jgi:hypothetical protein
VLRRASSWLSPANFLEYSGALGFECCDEVFELWCHVLMLPLAAGRS